MLAPKYIAGYYTAFGLLAVLLLGPLMPPLQNGDEAAHVFRADQISHFGFLGVRVPDGEFGGPVDSGLIQLQHQVSPLQSPATFAVTRSIFRPLDWGAQVSAGYPNTAINPPVFYIPAAIAAALARSGGIELPLALVLMRIALGLASVLISAIAIALAGQAALWFYTILLLPMSMALSAAVSQDGPLLACTALAAALLLRMQTQHSVHRARYFLAACVLLAIVGMSRSPYVFFAALALAAPVRLSWRLAGLAGIIAAVLEWSSRAARYFPLPIRPNGIVSPSAQLLTLVTHPWRAPLLALHTLLANEGLIGRSFIGQLGWLDIGLPGPYRLVAWAVLGLALLLTLRHGHLVARRTAACYAVAILGAAAAVAMAQYMTWTVVGSPVIEGIQGRYFLPAALLLGLFVRPSPTANSPEMGWLAVPVLFLPVFSIAVSVHAIVLRYYL